MTRYQVDSEAVINATGAVRNSISRIQSEVSGLYGQLTNLQGSWSGQAATAFQTVVTDLTVGSRPSLFELLDLEVHAT